MSNNINEIDDDIKTIISEIETYPDYNRYWIDLDKALKRVITESPEAKEKINTQIVWDTLEDL